MACTNVTIQGLSGADIKSRYTKFYCGHWRGRGIAFTNRSRKHVHDDLDSKFLMASVRPTEAKEI